MGGLGILDLKKFARALRLIKVALVRMGGPRTHLDWTGAPMWCHGNGAILRLHQQWHHGNRMKLTNNAKFYVALSYLMQFESTPTSFMVPIVWGNCPSPQSAIFCLVDSKKWVWTGGKTSIRTFQLCKRERETKMHLLFQCIHSLHNWYVS
jgi:hypothetical protein